METQPQPAGQGSGGLFTAPSVPLSPCSGFTPCFGQVYSSSQGWASTWSTDSIPTLPLAGSFSSSKLSFQPPAGKMTSLAGPFCHSIPAVNKTLSVWAAFPRRLYLFADRFSPLTETQIPPTVTPFPTFPQRRDPHLLKGEPKQPFLRPAFPSPPLPASLGGVGCETKPFSRLLTCTGELIGEFRTSSKMDSSGSHSSPRSCSLARIMRQTHQ